MATARGHHRHEDLRPPGGDRPLRHPAGADPRLLRPEGRHLRQHPRRPGHRRQDGQRADPELRLARGRARAHRRRSRAPSANRTCSSTPRTRACPSSLATVQRDVDVDFDIAAEAAREPDRSRVREVFREYELRDPLRRLEEALGDPEVAAPRAGRRGDADARACAPGRPADIAQLGERRERAVRGRARERGARGRAVRRGRRRGASPWPARGGEVLAGDCAGPRGGRRRRAASAPWSPTTPRRSGSCPPGARRTTRCSAPTCSSRPAAATRSPSCARSGASPADLEDPLAARRACCWARWPTGSASRSPSAACEQVMSEIELPLVAVLREMELLGVRLNLERLAEITERVRERDRRRSNARSSRSPGRSS